MTKAQGWILIIIVALGVGALLRFAYLQTLPPDRCATFWGVEDQACARDRAVRNLQQTNDEIRRLLGH